jgi:hypothetical protein
VDILPEKNQEQYIRNVTIDFLCNKRSKQLNINVLGKFAP